MGRPRSVYFAMIDGAEIGPMSRAEFALRVASDMVDEETYVWKQGMQEWLPASKVGDLAGVFKLRPGAAVTVNNAVQPGNNAAPKPEDS